MSFVKNIKDKFTELKQNVAYDGDELESAVSDDDFEDAKIKKARPAAGGIFDDDFPEPPAPLGSTYYSPTSAFDDGDKGFEPLNTDFSSSGFRPVETETPKPAAHTGNIYDINSAKSAPKFKLTFITLHDIYDSKNVANLMIEKNTIVVVNLSMLSEEESKRSMDFLDGAKYVTKSVFARFTESICAFIPSDIELSGDFYNQVEL